MFWKRKIENEYFTSWLIITNNFQDRIWTKTTYTCISAFGLLSLIFCTRVFKGSTVFLQTRSSSKAGRWLCSCKTTISHFWLAILFRVSWKYDIQRFKEELTRRKWHIYWFSLFLFWKWLMENYLLVSWHDLPKSNPLRYVDHIPCGELFHHGRLILEWFLVHH